LIWHSNLVVVYNKFYCSVYHFFFFGLDFILIETATKTTITTTTTPTINNGFIGSGCVIGCSGSVGWSGCVGCSGVSGVTASSSVIANTEKPGVSALNVVCVPSEETFLVSSLFHTPLAYLFSAAVLSVRAEFSTLNVISAFWKFDDWADVSSRYLWTVSIGASGIEDGLFEPKSLAIIDMLAKSVDGVMTIVSIESRDIVNSVGMPVFAFEIVEVFVADEVVPVEPPGG
jgi:hypothetical protein